MAVCTTFDPGDTFRNGGGSCAAHLRSGDHRIAHRTEAESAASENGPKLRVDGNGHKLTLQFPGKS